MKQVIIAVVMLTLTSGAYAGPVVEQLESMTDGEAVTNDIQVPSGPVDVKATSSFCQDNPMAPGCPKFCHTIGWGHPSCPPPLYCHTNPNGYGCPKSAAVADKLFNEDLAKANCTFNPNAPGCPGYCRDHKMYPGCPMFCQLNPLHKACGHVPEYCSTNPNGYGCPKSAGTGGQAFDKELAKANCTTNPNTPGCPLYCKDHHSYPGCPLFCQLNPLHPACGHVPEYCSTNPNGYGCQ